MIMDTTEAHLTYKIAKSYNGEKTLHLHYKEEIVYGAQEINRSLF